MIPAFKSTAEELLKNSGLSVVELLAKALAKAVVSQCSSSFSPFLKKIPNLSSFKKKKNLRDLSCNVQGYTEIKKRSHLTSMENYVTLLLETGRPIFTQT